MRMARQLVPGPDADDLVAEAFVRVMSVVQAGKGPDEFFRAYLLSTIRRLHIDRIRATQRVRPTGDEAELDRVVRFVDPVEMTFEQKAAADAFASLPERWQLVLWHLDVEGQKPAQIAPLLGLSPNSVSALVYRAREGLRLAYLQGHLAPPRDDNCTWTTSHLGQYVRKALSKRDTVTVDDHLEICSRCSALYLELAEVNSNLPGLLAPVVIGTAATATFVWRGRRGGRHLRPARRLVHQAVPVDQQGRAHRRDRRRRGGGRRGQRSGGRAGRQVGRPRGRRCPLRRRPDPASAAPAAPGPELDDPTKPTPSASTLAPTPSPLPSRDEARARRQRESEQADHAPDHTPDHATAWTDLDRLRSRGPVFRRGPSASSTVDADRRVGPGRGPTGQHRDAHARLQRRARRQRLLPRRVTSGWACGSFSANQQLTTVTCSLTQSGSAVPPLELSLFGCNPTVTVSVAATNNQDGSLRQRLGQPASR